MKREKSRSAIQCKTDRGPVFGNRRHPDIYIASYCNEENSCWIDNDSNWGYKCHPKYKCPLFVNTAGPDEENYFSVLDYEVFTHV